MSMTTFLMYLAGLASGWFVFKKMGREGWEGVIPFYNNYILCEILYNDPWKCLFLLIPFYNIYIWFKLNIDLARHFNLEKGFGVGMSFFPFIFRAILGFNDKIQYGEGQFHKTNSEIINEFSGTMNLNIKKDDSEEIKKYNSLYEEGLISKEDYEAKKRQILKL